MEENKSLPIAKTLSENDIELLNKKILNIDRKLINPIFIEFSNTLNSIIAITIKQSTDEDDIVELERAKRILALCPLEEKLFRVKDKIWNVRKYIIEKNSGFFLNRDYSKMIKQDGNKAFIEAMMEIVKTRFNDLTKKEQDFYWKKATKLLNLVARFKQLVND